MKRFIRAVSAAVTAAVLAALVAVPGQAQAQDPFYRYTGSAPLSSYAPGAVLNTRTLAYHVLNVPTPVEATQILYRSTNALGAAVANVTTTLRVPGLTNNSKGLVSYQSFYDSLNPEDSPSRIIAGKMQLLGFTKAGNINTGGVIMTSEAPFISGLLLAGYPVNIPDTEGQNANFAAGPEYGKLTLDSLRAVRATPKLGITKSNKIGLIGYSGGAIASNWAAIVAPSYAPEINRDIVGVAQGGILVNPATNLRYANGSPAWAGVVGMAIAGIARSFDVDFTKYLSDFGKQTMARLQDASISNAYLQYPGLTWEQMVKPQYRNPNSVPEFVEVVNKINMGTAALPTVPMFIGQAALGELELTPAGGPGIGRGDGVMVAGDVRSLARRYCDAGLSIKYDQYDALSHIPGAVPWYPTAVAWLGARFAGAAAPSDCGRIAPGNSLAPQKQVPPGR